MIGARVALAHVHRERDELDQAVDVLEAHLDAALREGHVAICTLGEVELARIGRGPRQGRRRSRPPAQGPRGTEPLGASRGSSPSVLDVAECRLRLQQGDVERAVDLLADLPDGPERTLLAARSEIAAGHPEVVEALLADLRAERGRPAAVVRGRRPDGPGPGRDGRPRAARRTSSAEVAQTACREGAFRTFLDEGFDLLDPASAVAPAVGRPARCRGRVRPRRTGRAAQRARAVGAPVPAEPAVEPRDR